MEPLPSGSTPHTPFLAGSPAHALFQLRALAHLAARIRLKSARARALTELALVARALETRAAPELAASSSSSSSSPSPSRDLIQSIRALLPPQSPHAIAAASAQPPPGSSLLAWITSRPASLPPLPPHRASAIADLIAALFDHPPETAILHAIAADLAAGDRAAAFARAHAIPPGTYRDRALDRIASGLSIRDGLTAHARFIANLDDPADAALYRPSLPLFRELLASGARAEAEAQIPHLRGRDAQEARALWAAAAYAPGSLARPLALLRAVRHADARRRGLLSIVAAALAADQLTDAESLAAIAPSIHDRSLAALAIARWLAQKGQRLAARRRLQRIDDPSLAHAIALERAALDLDAGLTRRALARFVSFPSFFDPRVPPPPFPPLAGGDGLSSNLPARNLAVCIALWIRSDLPARDPLRPRPHELSRLLTDPERLAAVLARPECASLDVRRFVDLAPRELRARLEIAFASAALAERTRALHAAIPAITAAPIVDASLPLPRERAFLLGTLGSSTAAPRLGDALSEARTFFDEGVAFTSARATKRTALLTACKIVLRSLLIEVGEPNAARRPIFLSRLRGLVALGGEPAAEILDRLLRADPAPSTWARRQLFPALAELSPTRAAALFRERFDTLTATGREAGWAASILAAHRAMDPDAGDAWRSAYGRLDAKLGAGAPSWLSSFARAFLAESGSLPGSGALRTILPDAAKSELPPSGEAFVSTLIHRRNDLLRRPPEAFARALHAHPESLVALRAAAPDAVSARQHAWDDSAWNTAVRRLVREIGPVAMSPLRRLCRSLRHGQDVARALLSGASPTSALASPVPLGSAASYAIRYLDKRRHFPAFLRFADVVLCCFNSRSSMYPSTQRRVLALWKDPLSFCLQILHRRGAGDEACGFVFGSFGESSGRAAVLLNGVYLRRQIAWLRLAIVEAIERHLCLPLGIHQVAIATCHGGRGPLPGGYRAVPRRVHRLRALADPGGMLARTTYDDISSVTNAELTTHGAIHWKDLARASAVSGERPRLDVLQDVP